MGGGQTFCQEGKFGKVNQFLYSLAFSSVINKRNINHFWKWMLKKKKIVLPNYFDFYF